MLQLARKCFKQQCGRGKEGALRQAQRWALTTAFSPGHQEKGSPRASLSNVIPNINPPGKKPCALKSCLLILVLENEDNNTQAIFSQFCLVFE